MVTVEELMLKRAAEQTRRIRDRKSFIQEGAHAPRCKAQGCGTELTRNNRSGYCQAHWKLSLTERARP